MNVASLELCKELYEISGWRNDVKTGWFSGLKDDPRPFVSEWWGDEDGFVCPAYSAGYLLRKLPRAVDRDGRTWGLSLETCDGHPDLLWMADYVSLPPDRRIVPANMYYFTGRPGRADLCHADIAEDSLALVAIGLFTEGVLTRDGAA